MAIPPTAVAFGQALDPHEELDWLIACDGILESDETIVSYTLTLLPEAVALGLTLMEGEGRDHRLTDNERGIAFWATIADAYKTSPAFDGGGVSLPGEVTLVTNSLPDRTRNRTWLMRTAQQ